MQGRASARPLHVAVAATAVAVAACARLLAIDEVGFAPDADAAADALPDNDAPDDVGRNDEDAIYDDAASDGKTDAPLGCARTFVDLGCDGGTPADAQVLFYTFDEGGGNDVADCFVTHNGVLDALDGGTRPQWGPGYNGSALEFTGTGFVRTGGSDLNCADAVTVSAWIKIKAGLPGTHIVVSRDPGSGGAYTLSYQNPSPYFVIDTSTGFQGAGAGSVPGDRWVHVAGVFQSNKILRAYMDGRRVGDVVPTGGNTFTGGPLYIGIDISGGGPTGPFLGAIDEVRIFHRALSDCEIDVLSKF